MNSIKEIITGLIAGIDDKAGIIIALTIICCVAMYQDVASTDDLLKFVSSGLLGMAVGRKF